jgi:hypothetical protein
MAFLKMMESTMNRKQKTFLIGTALLLIASSASAQQFIGGDSGSGDRARIARESGIVWTPNDAACYRANYASTSALERCQHQMITRANGVTKSRHR